MSSYLDHLPTREQRQLRQRLRSPEAYEALREKVKGPEDLEREMQKSERLADAHMTLESEPQIRENLKHSIERDIAAQGIERIMEGRHLSPEATHMIEQGRFDVRIDAHPDTNNDALVILTEGNVRETVPVQVAFSEQYVRQVLGDASTDRA